MTKRILRRLVWLLDEALDRLPAYEDGRWYRYGQWGCRLRLHRYWSPEDPQPGAARQPCGTGWPE